MESTEARLESASPVRNGTKKESLASSRKRKFDNAVMESLSSATTVRLEVTGKGCERRGVENAGQRILMRAGALS